MNEHKFLPVTPEEVKALGRDVPDFVYVCGDAYVDHPSFGCAIISRVLEAAGYVVAILPQPDYKSYNDFMRFGKPSEFQLITVRDQNHGSMLIGAIDLRLRSV